MRRYPFHRVAVVPRAAVLCGHVTWPWRGLIPEVNTRMTSHRPVRVVLPLLAASLFAAIGLQPVGAQTLAPSPRVSEYHVSEGLDFATTHLDAWDMIQIKDIPDVEGLSHKGFSNVRVESGVWKGTAEPLANVRLLQSWNSLPNDRDGETTPIDADTYTRMALRIRMTGAANAWGEVSWYDCGRLVQSCRGAQGFRIEEGWQTIHLDLALDPARGDVQWAGDIRGLVITPTARGGNIEIDWIRLYEPGSGVRVAPRGWEPGTVTVWDRDKNPDNNTPENKNWGVLTTEGDPVTFDTDGMEPAGYYVYSIDPDGVASRTRRILINRRPKPRIMQPDALGGASYDAVVRGDLWDYSQPGDVGRTRNMTWSMSNGTMIGRNTSPIMSDSGFDIPLVDGQPLDGSLYTNFSIRVFYEGGFGLTADPGGGMNARLVWRTTAGEVRVSDDIVVYPGWNVITLDLDDYTPNELVEGGAPRAWDGQMIEWVRFDPHEDSGSRRFHVDWVRLAQNDKPTNGKFRFSFRDFAWERDSVAVVRLDRDDDGVGGIEVARRSVVRGSNRFLWTVPAHLVGTGEWYVNIEITDPRGDQTTAVSTGTLEL